MNIDIRPDRIVPRLRDHASNYPEGKAFVFYKRHNDDGDVLTWSMLWNEAQSVASQLLIPASAEKPGILLCCNDERNFVIGLVAIWMRGAVAIPASAGLQKNNLDRNAHILKAAQPDLILHDLPEDRVTAMSEAGGQCPALNLSQMDRTPTGDVTVEEENSGQLLQFTSGSTSTPKPVYLTAETLSSGAEAIRQTYGISASNLVLHWLPLYHDMGLIGSCISTMWAATASVILKPSIFIQRPGLWLEKIHEWRADTTSAPNFAYERLWQMLDDEAVSKLDLSCLKTVIIGGEPVSKSTLTALAKKLEPAGFSSNAFVPSYGLAEATLMVSAGKSETGPVYSTTHTESPVTGLGAPNAFVNVAIRDPGTKEQLSDNALGEVWLSGPVVGHVIPENADWRTPAKDQEVRTGDFGFFENGNLFLTGRDANKLIIRGKNIFAEDVEALAAHSQPAQSTGGIAAIGQTREGTEALTLLIEWDAKDQQPDMAELNRAMVSHLGIKPAEIITLKRLSLPRTSSGKIQRSKAKQMLATGDLTSKVIDHVVQTAH